MIGTSGTSRTLSSGANGRFRVSLAPGEYVVRALRIRGALPRPPAPLRVRVRAGHFTTITITYDTGIR